MAHVFKAGDRGKTRNNLDYEVTVVLQHPMATGKTIIANIVGDSIAFHDNGRFNFSDEPRCGIDLIPPKRIMEGHLKACPFCGERDQIYPGVSAHDTKGPAHDVHCLGCGVLVTTTAQSVDMRQVWNRRPAEDRMRAAVDELVNAVEVVKEYVTTGSLSCFGETFEVVEEECFTAQKNAGGNVWKSMKTVPYDQIVLFRTKCGNVFQEFIYDQPIDEFMNQTGAEYWMHIPPLDTPDES